MPRKDEEEPFPLMLVNGQSHRCVGRGDVDEDYYHQRSSYRGPVWRIMTNRGVLKLRPFGSHDAAPRLLPLEIIGVQSVSIVRAENPYLVEIVLCDGRKELVPEDVLRNACGQLGFSTWDGFDSPYDSLDRNRPHLLKELSGISHVVFFGPELPPVFVKVVEFTSPSPRESDLIDQANLLIARRRRKPAAAVSKTRSRSGYSKAKVKDRHDRAIIVAKFKERVETYGENFAEAGRYICECSRSVRKDRNPLGLNEAYPELTPRDVQRLVETDDVRWYEANRRGR